MLGVVITSTLNLHLLETVLPDRDVWGSTVFAVVHEDDPAQDEISKRLSQNLICCWLETYIPSGSMLSPI